MAARPGLTIEHSLVKQSCWGWYEKSLKTFSRSLRTSGWTPALPSSPWGGTSACTRPGIVITAYFCKQELLGMVRENLFRIPIVRHLGGVLGPSPSTWRTPTSARAGTDFREYFIEDILLEIVKLGILNFFWTPQTSGWSPGTIPISMEDPNISKARDWF